MDLHSGIQVTQFSFFSLSNQQHEAEHCLEDVRDVEQNLIRNMFEMQMIKTCCFGLFVFYSLDLSGGEVVSCVGAV